MHHQEQERPDLPKLSVAEVENFLGQYIHEQSQGKTLLSSPVEQSLEKSLGMAQPGILQNINFFWMFLDYFKSFVFWLIGAEVLLSNTANTEMRKRGGKVMSLLTFCALSSWKVPQVLFFFLSASCLYLLGEAFKRGKTIRWLWECCQENTAFSWLCESKCAAEPANVNRCLNSIFRTRDKKWKTAEIQ